jgi:hypothetical protein
MRQTMVRYRVKPGRSAENVRLIEAVYAALAERKPDGFHYATFRLDDGETFIHLATSDTAANPLRDLPQFRAFVENIGERCAEPPVTSEPLLVGAYGAFGR